MTNRQKYFLAQDNSCHWFLVKAEHEKEWGEWCDLDEDDEASWTAPEFATGIDSPSKIKFFIDGE